MIKKRKLIYGFSSPVTKRKRLFYVLAACTVFVILSGLFCFSSAGADDGQNESIEDQIATDVDNQLKGIDFSEFEKIIQELSQSAVSFFGGTSFWQKVQSILSGDFAGGFDSFFDAVLNVFFGEVLGFLPILATIIIVAILANLITGLKGSVAGKSVSEITHFVCYAVIVLIVSAAYISLLKLTADTVGMLKAQMDAIFPVLLTLLAAVGGTVSVSIFQPSIAVLAGLVVQVFTVVIIPICVFAFVFSVAGNISSNVKLDKFTSFFNSAFKWLVGTIFTLFLAFITIQGIVAGVYDGVSIRAAKFAIKSYIPILGGYLADGFNIIMASSILIKNAVGLAGLLLLFASIVTPVAKIAVFSLGLKLTSAILEPMADSKISNFVHAAGKQLNYLVVIILGVAFMYLIVVGLIMSTANVL